MSRLRILFVGVLSVFILALLLTTSAQEPTPEVTVEPTTNPDVAPTMTPTSEPTTVQPSPTSVGQPEAIIEPPPGGDDPTYTPAPPNTPPPGMPTPTITPFVVYEPDSDGDGLRDDVDYCDHEIGPQRTNGCPDGDGDSIPNSPYDDDVDIPDNVDECPTEGGLQEFHGCPDSDGDGVPNHSDACPGVPGENQFGVCLDSDGDGIRDPDDECPDDRGNVNNDGCPPDSDGDGVPDSVDQCPDEEGDPRYSGCPIVDSDGDGVSDEYDLCPGERQSPYIEILNGCDGLNQDRDHHSDGNDNCVNVANNDQADSDRDGIGDACDNCVQHPNGGQGDTDGDGIGNECDTYPVNGDCVGIFHFDEGSLGVRATYSFLYTYDPLGNVVIINTPETPIIMSEPFFNSHALFGTINDAVFRQSLRYYPGDEEPDVDFAMRVIVQFASEANLSGGIEIGPVDLGGDTYFEGNYFTITFTCGVIIAPHGTAPNPSQTPWQPTEMSMNGNANPQPAEHVYSWSADINVEWYHVVIAGSGGNVLDEWYQVGNTIDCFVTCALTPDVTLTNGNYELWVQGWNEPYGYGEWGSTAFTIDVPDPATSTDLATAGSLTTPPIAPAYTWTHDANTTHYHLVINDASGTIFDTWYTVGDTVICDTTCSVTPDLALANDNYQMWIQGWNAAAGYGAWSAPTNYTVAVPAPGLASGMQILDASTLSWTHDAHTEWYHVVLVNTAGTLFDEWFSASDTLSCATNCTLNLTTPLAEGDYTLWIQGWNTQATYGEWASGAVSYSTTPPVTPTPTTVPPTPTPDTAGCDATVTGNDMATLINTANAMSAGETLCLSAGATFTVSSAASGSNAFPTINTTITINGNGATLVRNGGSPAFRFFNIGSGGNLTLENITLAGGQVTGSSDDGGAIYVNGGTLALNNVTLTQNSSGDKGGAIYNNGGTVTISASSLTNNSADDDGGAIANVNGGTVTIVNGTVIENNSTNDKGGGIYSVDSGYLTIHNSSLLNNSASDLGGGAFIETNADLQNAAVGGNSARHGGGLFVAEANVSIISSVFNYNTATEHGGALFAPNQSGVISITGSLLTANSAAENGGAISTAGPLTIIDSIITANSAGDIGGGLMVDQVYGSTAVSNSCIAGNTASSYSGVFSDDSGFNAMGNWWGAADGPAGSGTGSGDEVNGYVDFGNFLTTSPGC